MKLNYNEMFDFIKKRFDIKNDTKLGQWIGISKSFLSELRNYKKGLTIEKFYKIADKTGLPERMLLEYIWRTEKDIKKISEDISGI